MKEVVIIGYSGHAFVAIDIFEQTGVVVKGYCDNDEKAFNPYALSYLGIETKLLADLSFNKSAVHFFVGIGNNNIRQKVQHFLSENSVSLANAIHPRSIISNKVNMGTGVLVAANATINPLCQIGNGAICNTSSSIDHECIIGDFAHICPGTTLCGNVTVGRHSFIGANSVVKQGVSICDHVIIGAGSTVVKDITRSGTYFGNALRPL